MEKKTIVYMPSSCYEKMLEHIHIDPTHECGGFLIGDKTDMQNSFVFSVREIYYEPIIGTRSSFDFTTEYTSHAQEFVDACQEKNKSDDYIVGTYHSHATFDAFVSSVDEVFAKRFNLMLICSPSTKKIETWYWSLAESKWFKGDLIVYNVEPELTPTRTVSFEETTICSGKERFPMRIFKNGDKPTKATLKVLMVGCGTLGNLLAQHFTENDLQIELTCLDRDRYEVANLPRSPLIGHDAIGEPKAFALAEAIARESQNDCTVRGIVGDVRRLGLDFYEQYDLLITPLDNLECRFYISYVSSVLRKPFVNLGTSYVGLNGRPSFSGDVFYKPAQSNVCLDCFYPLYRSNEKQLKKRVSCGGALPQEVSPQVISSSMLIASIAFLCIQQSLTDDTSEKSIGYNISDVIQSESFFEMAPVMRSNCCNFGIIHDTTEPIKTICVSEKTKLSSLYKSLNRLFLSQRSNQGYEIDMLASGLTQIKYRAKNPIHSILAEEDSRGRIYHIIKEDYFPLDHVYVVNSSTESKLIRIKIKERN